MDSVAIIILAAGQGTRMKSNKAKVLHLLSGRPMILYVVDTAVTVCSDNVIVVVGTQADCVKAVIEKEHQVSYSFQSEQLGTGHAVMCALPEIGDSVTNAVILCGDVPLVRPETIVDLISRHENEKNHVTLLAARIPDPTGYGRLVLDQDGCVERIVEERDATSHEKGIDVINTGIYCVDRQFLSHALKHVGRDNAQNEIYLTDIVGIAVSEYKRVGFGLCADLLELTGINTADDLLKVEAALKADETS
ncbi:MAG: NTP transferase domain-containing protein [Deltaproteobacteria bacterium]|nr:NTP transferase domain-containing protein [Deltaproteobacteria bacterium]